MKIANIYNISKTRINLIALELPKKIKLLDCIMFKKKKMFCVKVLRTQKNEQIEMINKEIQICQVLKNNPHRNIINIESVYWIDTAQNYLYKMAVIIMELGQISLDQQLPNLKLETKIRYIYDILNAVVHLHSLTISHRDIKLQNFVRGENGVLKLVDFGCSCIWHKRNKLTDHIQNGKFKYENTLNKGTDEYNPPEMQDSVPYKTLGATDVWMIAELIVNMLWKREGLEQKFDKSELMINEYKNEKAKSRYNFKIKESAKLKFPGEDNLIQLLKECFYYHPDNRIKSTSLFEQYKKKVFPRDQFEYYPGKSLSNLSSNKTINQPSTNNLNQYQKIQIQENIKGELLDLMLQGIQASGNEDEDLFAQIIKRANNKFDRKGESLMTQLRKFCTNLRK